MIYDPINLAAITILIILASYFILESVQAAAPSDPNRRPNMFNAVALAIIAGLLIAMAAILVNPRIHSIPEPPSHIHKEWLLLVIPFYTK